jgi:hypothetical protein
MPLVKVMGAKHQNGGLGMKTQYSLIKIKFILFAKNAFKVSMLSL